MHIAHVQNASHDQPQEGDRELENLQQVSARIIHDHLRLCDNEEVKDSDVSRVINLLKPEYESVKKRREKERRHNLYKEVKYLYYTEEVPLKIIANRLDLSYYKLRKAINCNEANPDMIFDR